jgi:hypothetical protein
MGDDYKFSKKQSVGGFVLKRQRVIKRNYKLNQQRVAMLGSQMAKVKFFSREIQRVKNVSPNKNVVLKGGATEIKLYRDRSYEIIGSIKYSMKDGGNVFDIIRVNGTDGVLADINGKIQKKVVNLNAKHPTIISYDFASYPSNVKMVPAEKDKVINKPTKIDFELRYDGIRDNNFFITYINFNTKKGRDAGSFETFTYDKETSKIITLAGLTIKVISVNRDKIDFVVIDDRKLVTKAEQVVKIEPVFAKKAKPTRTMEYTRHKKAINQYNPAYRYVKVPAPVARQPIKPDVECCVAFPNKK